MFVRTDLMRQPVAAPASAAPAPVAAAAGAAGTALALTALTALAVPLRRAVEPLLEGHVTVDGVVAVAVLALGVSLAAWYALTGLAVLVGVLVRRSLGVARWGAPALRRFAAGTALSAAAFGAAPAWATPDVPDDIGWGSSESVTASLEVAALPPDIDSPSPAPVSTPEEGATEDGPPPLATSSPLPEVPQVLEEETPATPALTPPSEEEAPSFTGDAAPPQEGAPVPAASPTPAGSTPSLPAWVLGQPWTPAAPDVDTDTTHYTVRPGDCLWTIAAAELPPGAPDATIAERVADYIQSNPELRANPDLIHPGDVLTRPALAQEALS